MKLNKADTRLSKSVIWLNVVVLKILLILSISVFYYIICEFLKAIFFYFMACHFKYFWKVISKRSTTLENTLNFERNLYKCRIKGSFEKNLSHTLYLERTWSQIFSHVRPFHEQAVSNLDRFMHRSLWAKVAHSSFTEGLHTTKKTAFG